MDMQGLWAQVNEDIEGAITNSDLVALQRLIVEDKDLLLYPIGNSSSADAAFLRNLQCLPTPSSEYPEDKLFCAGHAENMQMEWRQDIVAEIERSLLTKGPLGIRGESPDLRLDDIEPDDSMVQLRKSLMNRLQRASTPASSSRSSSYISSNGGGSSSSSSSSSSKIQKRGCGSSKELVEQQCASGERSVSLGARGRYYWDLLEEDRFLQSKKPCTKERFRVLTDWQRAFRNYHDTYDSTYREWLIAELRRLKRSKGKHKSGIRAEVKEAMKSFHHENGAITPKKACNGLSDATIHTGGSLTANGTGSKILARCRDQDTGHDAIFVPAPPVPITTQHPASWGLSRIFYDVDGAARRVSILPADEEYLVGYRGKRTNVCTEGNANPYVVGYHQSLGSEIASLQTRPPNAQICEPTKTSPSRHKGDCRGDVKALSLRPVTLFECIHPANFTKLKYTCNSNKNNTTNCHDKDFRMQEKDSDVHAVDPPGKIAELYGLDDVDELDVVLHVTYDQLATQERVVQRQLRDLESAAVSATYLEDLRCHRRSLESLLANIATEINPHKCDRHTYVRKPFTANMHVIDEQLEAEEEAETSQIKKRRYSTRCTSEATDKVKRRRAENNNRFDMCGALLVAHVPHGEFVKALLPGMHAEVLMKGTWIAAVVKNVVEDGPEFTRLLKMHIIGGACSDSLWVHIEDGRIAPPGTHINIEVFKSMVQSLRVPPSTLILTGPSKVIKSERLRKCQKAEVSDLGTTLQLKEEVVKALKEGFTKDGVVNTLDSAMMPFVAAAKAKIHASKRFTLKARHTNLKKPHQASSVEIKSNDDMDLVTDNNSHVFARSRHRTVTMPQRLTESLIPPKGLISDMDTCDKDTIESSDPLQKASKTTSEKDFNDHIECAHIECAADDNNKNDLKIRMDNIRTQLSQNAQLSIGTTSAPEVASGDVSASSGEVFAQAASCSLKKTPAPAPAPGLPLADTDRRSSKNEMRKKSNAERTSYKKLPRYADPHSSGCQPEKQKRSQNGSGTRDGGFAGMPGSGQPRDCLQGLPNALDIASAPASAGPPDRRPARPPIVWNGKGRFNKNGLHTAHPPNRPHLSHTTTVGKSQAPAQCLKGIQGAQPGHLPKPRVPISTDMQVARKCPPLGGGVDGIINSRRPPQEPSADAAHVFHK
jgi:hypothetical protein